MMAMFTMIFTSCSKEEVGVEENQKATISFEAVVNDLLAKKTVNKQAIADIPSCSDDDPAYVRIVLMQGDNAIVGTSEDPYRVNLVTGQTFTNEDPALELEPGNYSLDHFSVYNAMDELIWIAPRMGAELASFVDNPLPLAISLGAGVKKYVDVPVLCYDEREVNEYGYLFFELETVEALTFCFFANYCDDNGRHFTANYSVDIWLGTDASGEVIYEGLTPDTGINDDGDFFASPLCVALPGNDDPEEDYIYYEVTLQDWDENYGSATPIVLTGTLSRSDIEANFGPDMTVEYEHLYFNCEGEGEEPTGPACLPALTGDCERVIFIQMVGNDRPSGETEFYPIFTEDGDEVGTIRYNLVKRNAMRDLLTASVQLDEEWTATNARFTLPNINEDDVCVNNINDDSFDLVYEAGNLTYPIQARVAVNVCPE